MGNILKDSQGNVLVASGNAFEVTAAIDSNIQAGNIKKDVTILGVTGTYEGSGGSNVISFTVNGTTYQAEKDTTWQEWMNSAYYNSNYGFSIELTYGYVIQNGLGIESPTSYNFASSIKEHGHNVIKSNRAYIVSGGGSN